MIVGYSNLACDVTSADGDPSSVSAMKFPASRLLRYTDAPALEWSRDGVSWTTATMFGFGPDSGPEVLVCAQASSQVSVYFRETVSDIVTSYLLLQDNGLACPPA